MAPSNLLYTIPSFFFNDTATTEIYTLSLNDALPISGSHRIRKRDIAGPVRIHQPRHAYQDRKSTRLNSSHITSSYDVFCLKKQNRQESPSRQKKLIQQIHDPQSTNNNR